MTDSNSNIIVPLNIKEKPNLLRRSDDELQVLLFEKLEKEGVFAIEMIGGAVSIKVTNKSNQQRIIARIVFKDIGKAGEVCAKMTQYFAENNMIEWSAFVEQVPIF